MQEIICILDGSGSMGMYAQEAVNGFNNFLKEQKEVGEANLTVVWFDNEYSVAYEGKLSEAKPLDAWNIGGMTALYDAIGKTFFHVKDRFTKEKPEKVIMAIQTDGLENCSKEFSKEFVKSLIEEHENKYGWDVLFLGAGLDVTAQANAMGIQPSKTFAYDKNKTEDGFKEYSVATVSFRG